MRGIGAMLLACAFFACMDALLKQRESVELNMELTEKLSEQANRVYRRQVLREQLYCFDGARISCSGGTAAIDLAVELLSRACGRARALKGLADMLVDETRDSRHALRSLEQEPDHAVHDCRPPCGQGGEGSAGGAQQA